MRVAVKVSRPIPDTRRMSRDDRENIPAENHENYDYYKQCLDQLHIIIATKKKNDGFLAWRIEVRYKHVGFC